MDLTEAEDIKKRWQEYTEELYKKYLHDPDNARKFGKLSSGHRTGKGQFSFQSLRNTLAKNTQTMAQLNSSHMLVK